MQATQKRRIVIRDDDDDDVTVTAKSGASADCDSTPCVATVKTVTTNDASASNVTEIPSSRDEAALSSPVLV